ncbi:E3 ubiquitin-protein ligase RHF2A isoform X3 [Manihot esculenta]|uniref:E3 ubiquitin-protein ligase RHF2A isoform X3 n=1 Tax=Manihot esculenta TaxID=3983 RepID=UPI001CC627F3|nr:E3 ubiquitin-protein ligase RHF2A isoform X3 [Manihot esculenta]XP_043815190.1 E3 ubiquitin-protein ligase RHF2A isoform X3 [Manihot esculenta]
MMMLAAFVLKNFVKVILQRCQRSSQCPMCLQSINLKDPTSQELLEAVERERNFRAAPSRNATIFRHPTLGDFELQHLPVGASDSDLEERIIQHLAAAAAMGRTHHFSRRDVQRNRQSSHGRPHFLVFSTHPGAPSSGHVSSSPTEVGGENEPAAVSVANPSSPIAFCGDPPPQQNLQFPSAVMDQGSSASGSAIMRTNHQGMSFNNRTASHSSSPNEDRGGPSEFQSFSESLKSRLNAVSMRYKESISRSTRGWKERLFSRSSSDLGSEIRREVNAGIASVSCMMEHLETGDNSRANQVSVPTRSTDYSVAERSNQNNANTGRQSPLNESNTLASCAASPAST